MDKILIAAVCFLVVLGCTKPTLDVSVSNPDATDQDVPGSEDVLQDVLDIEQVESEATEAVSLDVVQETEEVVEEAEVYPDNLAWKFLTSDGNGGKSLCRGFAIAMAPELDSSICAKLSDERREACYNARRPLEGFVDILCDTVIAGALLFDLDPVMCLAVIERESSFGRVLFDRVRRTYHVNTDICELYLKHERIAHRARTDRPGIDEMTWTYAGGTGRNSQRVRVVEETDEGILVNTCVAGETGVLQALPGNYRRGTVVEVTGEVLEGSRAELRRRMEEDVALQVNIGLQELARHRDLFPEGERSSWWGWLGTYNTGSTTRGDHWRSYVGKVARHYLEACEVGYLADRNPPIMVKDLWPACVELRSAYDSGL